jgi:hypothetical protein
MTPLPAPHDGAGPGRTPVEATRRLTAALTRVGDALAAVDAEALLAAEAELNGAVVAVQAVPLAAGDREALLSAVRGAQAALLRCRRLGASWLHLARAFMRVGGADPGYDRAGVAVERPAPSLLRVLRVRA